MNARAKDICFELNHTRPSAKNKRKELIDQLFQTTTDNVSISIPLIQIMVGTLN